MDLKLNMLVKVAVGAIMRETAGYERGQTIPHELLESLSGIVRYTQGWNLLVKKLKRRFEADRGITLWSEPEVGYRLCTTQEQLHDCVLKRADRAMRQLRRGRNHMLSIPAEELSEHEQGVRGNKLAAQAKAEKELRRARKFVRAQASQPTSEVAAEGSAS